MSFAELHWMGGTLFMSVLSISFTVILGVTILNILRVMRGNYKPDSQFLTIGDIKAIGIFAIVWGVFGQSIGLFSALQALEASPDVSPSMVYGGIKVSTITTLYGTFIFLVSWLITLILNNWERTRSK